MILIRVHPKPTRNALRPTPDPDWRMPCAKSAQHPPSAVGVASGGDISPDPRHQCRKISDAPPLACPCWPFSPDHVPKGGHRVTPGTDATLQPISGVVLPIPRLGGRPLSSHIAIIIYPHHGPLAQGFAVDESARKPTAYGQASRDQRPKDRPR